MPVKEILLLRHGHRLAWTLDPNTGKYTSNHPFPTRLPADPPLASHGVRQATETGDYLGASLLEVAKQDRLRIYSSLFYRCLETLRPTIENLRSTLTADSSASKALLRSIEVRGEKGIGEWFGHAWFEQPEPATTSRLQTEFFPWLDINYRSQIVPDRYGEHISELHNRIAKALGCIIRDVDEEFTAGGRDNEDITLLICGHAAQIICSGRALTGKVPDDLDEEDFKCFTCGISRFSRRQTELSLSGGGDTIDERGGIAGGWECITNSDCSHLSQGEERGWHFHGDESFDSYAPGTETSLKTSDGAVSSASKNVNKSTENTAKL